MKREQLKIFCAKHSGIRACMCVRAYMFFCFCSIFSEKYNTLTAYMKAWALYYRYNSTQLIAVQTVFVLCIPCMRARHSTSMRSIWCGILFHPRIIISLSLYLALDMVLFVDTEQMKSEMLSTETLPCVRVLVFTNRNRDNVAARNFITLTRKNGNNRRASSSKAFFLNFHCVSKPTKSFKRLVQLYTV